MAALRTGFKVASLGAVGAGVAYTGYQYYTTTQFFFVRAHAELPSDSKAALKKMEWKGFTELKLQSSEQVNHNVKKLTFALPDDDSITGITPITSLLTQHTPDGGFIPVFRPYTPVSDNDIAGTVTFMIKKYPGGKGSGKMHSLVPGDTMKFKPLQEFEYKPNQFKSMLFVAGGSGITPIYQLTRAILKNPEDKTKISLVYANNTEEDILLRQEFEELERQYPDRFQKLFTVSKLNQANDGSIAQGYVTKQMINKIWAGKEAGQKVLVSGPPAMVEAIAGAKGGFGWTQGSVGGILKELGYTKEDVHKF
ncbi:hypothetical protein H2198_007005 [Neophaeococcomyces mojaviensis]|uniref:Uncharacterized protein n=1 Tax=Neophaeococcomyces mojaviensis TaxID=3383035 RepID=A0ACC3A160_9EURO|nr:hypothetical protein H2198_007005 [Knufia sp. JES_112]